MTEQTTDRYSPLTPAFYWDGTVWVDLHSGECHELLPKVSCAIVPYGFSGTEPGARLIDVVYYQWTGTLHTYAAQDVIVNLGLWCNW